MKIYFTAAISLSEYYGKNYIKIVDTLEKLGHTVTHQHITKNSIIKVFNKTREENIDYYKKTLKEIAKADIVVAEVSFPSTLNVGHEVSVALEKGKPVIALYSQDKGSPFFEGIDSDLFYYQEYKILEIDSFLPKVLEEIAKHVDIRFNFFISPEIGRYLDWISQHKKIPRAAFLRSLIEKSMKIEKDFGKE
jgi:MinD-like ATPase involved in chromosome partitioning or flagellar assembly